MIKFMPLALLIVLAAACQKNVTDPILDDHHLDADSTRLVLLPEAGAVDSFTIKSNTDWKITVLPATADWFSTSITGGNGDSKVLVVTKENTSDTIQRATIIISAVNVPGLKADTITVSQQAPDKIARNAYGGLGAEHFYCAVATADGGIIAVGEFTIPSGDLAGATYYGEEDAWIVKTDAAGEIVWKKTLGGSGRDRADYITVLKDGNYLVAAAGSVDGDFAGTAGNMLVKIDGTGKILWKKGVDMDVNSVVPAFGGGYVLGSTLNNDFCIAKTDDNFTISWQKTYGGTAGQVFPTDVDYAYSLVPASDNNGYVLAGRSETNNGHATVNKGLGDFWVIKVDLNGDLVWQKSFGGGGYDECYSMARAQDGGYVLAGYTESIDGDVAGNHGYRDGWVLKIDANGNKVWAKTLGGSDNDLIGSITALQGGGFLVAGDTQSSDGDISDLSGWSDGWVVKLSENGSLIWSKTPGGSDEDYPHYVLERSPGKYVLLGTTYSDDGDVVGLNGYGDGWIFRFNW